MFPHFKKCSTGVLHVKNISSCVRISVFCQRFWMLSPQKWKPLKGSCNLIPPYTFYFFIMIFVILSHSKQSTELAVIFEMESDPGKITRY